MSCVGVLAKVVEKCVPGAKIVEICNFGDKSIEEECANVYKQKVEGQQVCISYVYYWVPDRERHWIPHMHLY